MKNYELYIFTYCPFCQKVLRFMEENKVEGVEVIDIDSDPKHAEYLIEKGGKKQAPCLFIDGEPMYESDDIIQYMKDNILDNQAPEPLVESQEDGPTICPF